MRWRQTVRSTALGVVNVTQQAQTTASSSVYRRRHHHSSLLAPGGNRQRSARADRRRCIALPVGLCHDSSLLCHHELPIRDEASNPSEPLCPPPLLFLPMGKTPTHKNKGKRGHKLSHKTARRTKSALAPPDLMYKAFHLQNVEVRCTRALLRTALKRRTRDRPQSAPPPLDEDLPGMGQFYCNVTGCVGCCFHLCAAARRQPAGARTSRRHFESADALARHERTKAYKKQCVQRRRTAFLGFHSVLARVCWSRRLTHPQRLA